MSKFILALSFFSVLASAEIPDPIVQNQNFLVNQGECEADWRSSGDDLAAHHMPLAGGIELWIVNCAFWSVNNQTSAYLQIPGPNGDMFKPISFVDYDFVQGVHATSIGYNLVFDSSKGSLESHNNFDTHGLCGSAAHYEWNLLQERFDLKVLAKSDDCINPKSWEVVLHN